MNRKQKIFLAGTGLLDDVIRNAASSDKGRQEIAEAIYQRLTEMEYV